MWIIYKHTNKINNKSYIGQTSQSLENRSKNGKGYNDSPKFWKAICKYGWDNFTHEILESDIETIDEADEKEAYYIQKFNSIENGYNISEGGGKHIRGKELARLISEGQKKNWENNLERKEKASTQLKLQWQDEEYRNKFIGSNNGNAKTIICVETGQIFPTLNEAASWANTSRQNITGVLRGRQNTAAGYHWKYYTD